MEVLAIVPARGGSKGVLRKNLASFNGAPLVVHSIRHAQASHAVTRVIVSTDDAEIRACALEHGAEAPFLRPEELSGDMVLDLPVFRHALEFLRDAEGYTPDLVVHLRPTTPHRKVEWIDGAVQLLRGRPDSDSVRSVSAPTQHPYRVFRINQEGFLTPIMKHEHPAPHVLRRQDLPQLYYYNCVVDVTKPTTIFEKASMTGERILPLLLDPDEVIDIDTARDLRVAELLFGGAP